MMLGKVVGGVIAVIGFTTAVVVVTRRGNPAIADILPPAMAGGFGILLFVLSSRLTPSIPAESPADIPTPADRRRTNILAWTIFALLAAVILIVTVLAR